jgi:heme/copper-type cytochrome/quinol oxidase subunit 2
LAKKSNKETDKKVKKSKKNVAEPPTEAAVTQPHFAHKRKKQEIDWLIIPIIIVILLIILFVIKIAVALIQFSQEETTNNTISVSGSGQSVSAEYNESENINSSNYYFM